jgi:uncharacterized membrane protein
MTKYEEPDYGQKIPVVKYWQPPPGWTVEWMKPEPKVKLGIPTFLMAAGQLMDLVTTMVGINVGKLTEVNPIARAVLDHGWAAIIGFKILFVMLVLVLLAPSPPKRRRRALLFVAAVGMLVSLSNALQAYLL